MSLIQQALEKTNRVHETRTTNPPPAPKTYERDPMGASLEQELTRIQHVYAKRRRLYWNVSLGVLLLCLFFGLSYVGIRQIPSGRKSASVRAAGSSAVQAVPQIPLKIFSGNIYRLTGITNMNGKSMAVINGEIVSVGDALSDKTTVKAIGNGEVRLDVQGREIKLTL